MKHMIIKKPKAVLLFILVHMLLLTAACQATPESQVVVNKIDSPLDELIMEKADPSETWPQPQAIVWNETKTVEIDNEMIDHYTVAVSIDVETPVNPGKVPVVIIEPKQLDIDFLTKTAKYLMEGEIYNGAMSKQDVTAEILDFKKDINTHSIRDGYQDQVDEHLELLNEQYEIATDGNSEARFEFDRSGYLHLKGYPDDSGIMDFLGYGSSFDFHNREFNKLYLDLNDKRNESVQAKATKSTSEQARATADEAMSTIFSEPFTMAHSNMLDKTDLWEPLWKEGEFTSIGQAYAFDYTRVYEGFASLYIKPAPKFESEEVAYSVFYPREYVSVVVDDRGIVTMHYESYSETVEMINDDVKLLPFAGILERFKNEVFYHNLWGTSKTDIKITRIDFGLVREPVKDNPDRYMMVPAWSFIGDICSDIANERGASIITLNAINGSVITVYPTIS